MPPPMAGCTQPRASWQLCIHQHQPHVRRNGRGLRVCNSCRAETYQRNMLTAATGLVTFPRTNAAGAAALQRGCSPRNLTWPTATERRTGIVLGLPPPGRQNPPWPGFLTRACNDCEILIQNQIHYRTTPAALPAWPHDPVIDGPMQEWQHYATVSCTCKFRLGRKGIPADPVLCINHLEDTYKNLLAKKNKNDIWLRNIQKNPKTGTLETASSATKSKRVLNGTWRACRVSLLN